MTSNIKSRRACEQIVFGCFERPRHGRFERGLEFDDEFLALCRADRHAAGGGGNRGGDQTVREGDEELAPWEVKLLTGGADNDRVMGRVDGELAKYLGVQTLEQRHRASPESDAGVVYRRNDLVRADERRKPWQGARRIAILGC